MPDSLTALTLLLPETVHRMTSPLSKAVPWGWESQAGLAWHTAVTAGWWQQAVDRGTGIGDTLPVQIHLPCTSCSTTPCPALLGKS